MLGGEKRHSLMWMLPLCLAIAVAAAVFSACSSVECDLQKKVECKMQFVDQYGNKVVFGGLLSVEIETMNDESLNDTVLNLIENASEISLPLSYANDTDVLSFSFYDKELTTEVTDEISITKTNEPVFESVDCTPRFNHTIKEVKTTNNLIDSIVVKNKKVDNNASKVHLYIYINTGL